MARSAALPAASGSSVACWRTKAPAQRSRSSIGPNRHPAYHRSARNAARPPACSGGRAALRAHCDGVSLPAHVAQIVPAPRLEGAGRSTVSRTLGPSPFVGRERELALLHGCLADATARGAGGVVLVSGEPGIGKTRLLAEFATQARKAGSLVLIGHSYDGEGTPPYLPFIEALRAYIREADPNELRGQLAGATRLVVLLPELRDRFPDLPAATAEPPERDRFGLFEAVTELLLTAARSAAGGLLLVLEDLHWADVATLALLQHLG